MDSQSQEKGAMLDKIQTERTKSEATKQTLEAEKLRLSKELEAVKLSVNQKEAEVKEINDSCQQLQQQLERVSPTLSKSVSNNSQFGVILC